MKIGINRAFLKVYYIEYLIRIRGFPNENCNNGRNPSCPEAGKRRGPGKWEGSFVEPA